MGGDNSVKTDQTFSIPKHINRRIDLPPEAYVPKDNECDYKFPKRTAYNTSGTEVTVGVNQFRVTACSNRDVFQYDVTVTPEPKHPVVYKKLWATEPIQTALKGVGKDLWIHDGVRLAWSCNNVEKVKLKIDLGKESGGTPGRDAQQFTMSIARSTKIRLEVLAQYLKGKTPWNKNVLECMNCLDHILRQGPSETFKLIKRTLFHEGADHAPLGTFVEAVKGTYSAMRMTESIHSRGLGLAVNVDVSNQSFFIGQRLDQLIRNFLANSFGELRNLQIRDMAKHLKPALQNGELVQSPHFKALKRLQRLRFATTHNPNDVREYAIFQFSFDKKLGPEGANAKTVKFEQKIPGSTEKRIISVYDYYLERHKCKIDAWQLPLIVTGKGGLFPIETCVIRRLNPYPFKLDPTQTAEMIRFAVTRPPQRKQQIMRSVALLNWGEDKYLHSFGVKINQTMPMVKARLIKNPEMVFNRKKLNPGTTGRWDLRGYQFAEPNREPLVSWSVIICGGPNTIDRPGVLNFLQTFKRAYTSHGGKIGAEPQIMEPSAGGLSMVKEVYDKTGNHFKKAPQILFFIFRNRDTSLYETVKRASDCYAGVVTQVLLANHARKASPQYCSNLAMKVNSKLGGITCISTPPVPPRSCFVGVDVSHGAPGAGKPSMASMCLSMDKDAAFYQARVQTNGWRVEVLEKGTVRSMFEPMMEDWAAKHKGVPDNLFYFRDGVAEGQFVHVLEHEIKMVRSIINEIGKKYGTPAGKTKITVIIATKRHHIRFFPERGDKNGNALPGTLVDKEVTHPFQYDFYLCSHVAIQGTARPVHYTVILDEVGLKVDELQKMIYHQCYQYCRSTTPVSLHPAVYYAHLAGNRGRPHEQVAETQTQSKAGGASATSKNQLAPPAPVVQLASAGRNDAIKKGFRSTMWYV